MNHEWFHRTSGMFGTVDEVGPISESEILALAMEGKLKRDTLVRSPTRTNNAWFLLPQIAGLAKALEDGEKSRQAVKDAQAQKKAAAKQEAAEARAAENAERLRQQQASEMRAAENAERLRQQQTARQEVITVPGQMPQNPVMVGIPVMVAQPGVQFVYPPKSRVAYVLLGLFLGGLGIHNFYAGHTGNAVTQLLLGLFGGLLCFIPNLIVAIWAIIEVCTVTHDGNGVRFN